MSKPTMSRQAHGSTSWALRLQGRAAGGQWHVRQFDGGKMVAARQLKSYLIGR